MITTISIVKYGNLLSPFGFLSMAFLRIPLWFNKKVSFWKLMGCGKNGTFDVVPDLKQWAFLATWDNMDDAKDFIATSALAKYWSLFGKEVFTIYCSPLESHGLWDGKNVFAKNEPLGEGHLIGVLTRATIRPSKMVDFWKNVPAVAKTISASPGFITSVGIGEVPFLRQATFSIWKDLDSVKNFAYRQREHAEVIKRTRQRNWYSEELFARFEIVLFHGTMNGVNPLSRG